MIMLLDTGNLFSTIKRRYNARLDYGKLLEHIEQTFDVKPNLKIAYGNQDETEARQFTNYLKCNDYVVKFKEGKKWTIEIVIAAMTHVPRGNILVLGTNDPVFAPLLSALDRMGADTYVVGCGIPQALRNVSNCYEIESNLLEVQRELKATIT